MELLQVLRQEREKMPKEMLRELNELWTKHECEQFKIMVDELQDAINMQYHPEAEYLPFENRRIYIEEFNEHWKVLSLLEDTKKREYEIYKKYRRA